MVEIFFFKDLISENILSSNANFGITTNIIIIVMIFKNNDKIYINRNKIGNWESRN